MPLSCRLPSARTRRERVRLALLRAAARLTPRSSRPSLSISRLLVIRPDHLGDLLFMTPALRALREAFPRAHIAALVGPWGREVAARNPHLDDVLVCEFPGFARQRKPWPWQPYVYLLQSASWLRRQQFDLALVMRFDHWWGALLAHLAGIPRRIGYDIPEVKPFLTTAVPYRFGQHEVEQNLELVRALNTRYSILNTRLEFWVSPEDEALTKQYLEARGVGERDVLVALHPGAGAAVKLWRNEAWAEVAAALARHCGAKIVVTGSTEERSMAEQIAARMQTRPLLAAGETTLGQLAALLRRCRLAIGTDSGPLHLAVAVGTPTVHLFGPADARLFGPWGDPARHRVVTSRLECVPCHRLDYAGDEIELHPCVRWITVEQVMDAARALL